jgi:hypothetical protein
VDSSAVGVEASSPATVLGSSPSQDKSVDFLHSTKLVVNQVRLPSYKYYSGKVFTYKLDRTTVTVGAPSMLAMSTSPASVGASTSAGAGTGSSAPVVVLGSGLLSMAGACGSTTLIDRCVICDTSSSTVGAGLRLLSTGLPTVSQSSPSPWSTGSDDGISCKHSEFNCQHTQYIAKDKCWTTLLEELTS